MYMKKNLKKILTISLLSSVVGVVGISLGSYYAASNALINSSQQEDSTTQPENDVYIEEVLKNIYKPTNFINITASKYYDQSSVFTSKTAYDNYLLTSKDEMLKTINSLDNTFDVNNFKLDIYSFLNSIHDNSNKNLSIYINESNFNYDSLNDSLSFEFFITLKNQTSQTISFKLLNNSYYLIPKQEMKLKISSDSQKFNFKTSINLNNFYLGWCIDTIFEINDKQFIEKNFSFIDNNISSALRFKIDGLVNQENYLDLNNGENYFENVTSKNIKNEIHKEIYLNTNKYLYMIEDIASLSLIIQTNPTFKTLVDKGAQNILNILYSTLSIGSEYNNLLLTLLKSNEPILKYVSDNKTQLSNLIAYFVNDPTITGDVIESFIGKLDYSLSDEQLQKEAEQLKELLTFFASSTSVTIDFDYINKIIDLVIKKDTTLISLIHEILIVKKDETINFINGFVSNKNIVNVIVEMLGIILDNNWNKKIIDSIIETQNVGLLTSLFEIINTSTNYVQEHVEESLISNLAKQVISKDNKNFTTTNLTNLFKQVINKLLNYFKNPNNYQVDYNFKSFSLNDKKVSYSYNVGITFIGKVSFEISSLIEILPDTVSLNGTSLPKSLLKKMLTQDNSMLTIEIGVGDKINFLFEANEQEMILNPKKVSGIYYAGFKIPYKLTMRLNMPHMVNSISTFYKTGLFNITNNSIYEVLVQFLENFIIRDYVFVGNLTYIDETKKIENYNEDVYLPNNYFKWKKINKEFEQKIRDNIQLVESNQLNVNKKVSSLFGQEKLEPITLTGKKPVFKNQEIVDEIIAKTMEYKSDIKPIIYIDPTLNADIDIGFAGISLDKIKINLVKIEVYFPYKVLHVTEENNLEYKNTFTVELSL